MQYRGRSAQNDVEDFSSSSPSPRKVARPPSPPTSTYVQFGILFFTCFAVNMDQLISAPNLTQISQEFHLSVSERDSLLGALIQFGFYFSAGVFSILSGPVIEVMNRSKILSAISGLSAFISCLSAIVPGGRVGFFYFLLVRVSTGVAVGVTLPCAFSLLGDIVPPSKRTTMSAFVTTSCAAGAAIGQALAGFCSSWRVPYFIAASLSVAACVLTAARLRDPKKSALEKSSTGEDWFPKNAAATAWNGLTSHSTAAKSNTLSMADLNWSKFQHVLRIDSNRLVFAQSMPGCIAWSSIATFLPDFIHKELGFTVKGSTGVMAAFGITGLLCSLAGSAVGQTIYNQDRKHLPAFVAKCIVTGAVPMILLALFGGPGLVTVLLAMGGGVAAAAGPNIRGILMNANPAQDRGSVFAMFNLIENLGKGLGPSVLVMITWVSGGSRRIAFASAFGLWFLSAWIANRLDQCLNEDTLNVEIKLEGSTNGQEKEPFDLLHIYHG